MKISIKDARTRKGIKQTSAAKILGVSLKTLQNYENGATYPTSNVIKKMIDLYNVEVTELNLF